jgi:hypothetical protein
MAPANTNAMSSPGFPAERLSDPEAQRGQHREQRGRLHPIEHPTIHLPGMPVGRSAGAGRAASADPTVRASASTAAGGALPVAVLSQPG